MSARARIGFVIDNHVPGWNAVRQLRCHPWDPLTGWDSRSSVGEMRFHWIAREVNRAAADLVYELYRPWRSYDGVVFLKSSGTEAGALAERLRNSGTNVIFDLNVDYLTPASGTYYYEGMRPTEAQRDAALRMTALSDAVIADSSHLAEQGRAHHRCVRWVPDNVNFALVPPFQASPRGEKLRLLWSGEAVKLFELLKIESVLRRSAEKIRLVLVTNDLSAMNRWFGDHAARFRNLLACLDHEIVPFRSVENLMQIYAQGGAIVSPRFLDNTYNLGHTEWKIALGMACGRVALCSPVPSYLDVAQRSGGRGIRICRTDDDWLAAIEELLTGGEAAREEEAARDVIRTHYSTAVVARAHREFIAECLAGRVN